MSKFFTITFALFWFSGIYAQKEASFWYFGNRTGFDFNSGSPIILHNGAMKTVTGSATISDNNTGGLLFYTNGKNVWNRYHQLMPNSNHVNFDNSNDQSSLIVPVPEKSSLYYLFSIADSISPEGKRITSQLKYSIVDMNLDNGKGDLIYTRKDILLQTNVACKITAIQHIDKNRYWLITHQLENNTFLIFSINSNGISATDSIQIGTNHTLLNSGYGYLKASPDGTKLACTLLDEGIDYFTFDASNGIISNFVDLGRIRGTVGVSFSPDNTKLYVTTLSKSN